MPTDERLFDVEPNCPRCNHPGVKWGKAWYCQHCPIMWFPHQDRWSAYDYQTTRLLDWLKR